MSFCVCVGRGVLLAAFVSFLLFVPLLYLERVKKVKYLGYICCVCTVTYKLQDDQIELKNSKRRERDANSTQGFIGIKPYSVKRREETGEMGRWNKIIAKKPKKKRRKAKKTTWLLQGGISLSLIRVWYGHLIFSSTTRSSARGQANKRPES